MHIIVQKFGGTSVVTKELREKAAKKAIEAKKEGKSPVVVVSAIGRKGDPYATDTLLQFGKNACSESNLRELDMLMACGEMISATILANTIQSFGYPSISLMGSQAGIITDENYGAAQIINVNNTKILDLLKKGFIPVVAGFQGVTEKGDITTLGRGGSDTTAAILGEALDADMVEIYTDVDGVMTADPRLVPDAKVIDQICYDEIYQMAEDGAKVVHPRAVVIAKRGNIPLKVKNTLSDSPGTIISNHQTNENKCNEKMVKNKILTAVTHKNNIAQVIIWINDSTEENELLMDELTNHSISIDLINFFVDKKVFTIDGKHIEKVQQILDKNKFNYKILKNCSKVTAVGHKMKGVPGVMARIVKALYSKKVQILQTSDSHTTISCLVKDCDTQRVVNALHKEFLLSE